MASNIDPIVLDGHDYVGWEPYMETLLKSKGLWKYMKMTIPETTDAAAKFVINGKKYEAGGVITTYISREIHFHTSRIDCSLSVKKKMKTLFDN